MILKISSKNFKGRLKYSPKTKNRRWLDCIYRAEIDFIGLELQTRPLGSILKLLTLNSLISMEFFLFFLRNFSQLHALLEPPRLLIFEEFSHLHDY